MARKQDNFYSRGPASPDIYTGSTAGTEIDMRSEMVKTMDGFGPEISKAQYGLLRRARRDESDLPIPCPCVDKVTQEPDKDRWCPICRGMGWMNDEVPIQFYRSHAGLDTSNALRDKHTIPGLINIPIIVFYIRYDSLITGYDQIVQVELDNSGRPVQPMRRVAIFSIGTVWDYRSDLGKLEYWKVFAHGSAYKYLNAPFYGTV